MKENEFYLVKECNFDNSLITEIYSILNNCFIGCHNNYFHKFKFESFYDIQLTNITNKEKIILTISSKNMNLYDLKKIQ